MNWLNYGKVNTRSLFYAFYGVSVELRNPNGTHKDYDEKIVEIDQIYVANVNDREDV